MQRKFTFEQLVERLIYLRQELFHIYNRLRQKKTTRAMKILKCFKKASFFRLKNISWKHLCLTIVEQYLFENIRSKCFHNLTRCKIKILSIKLLESVWLFQRNCRRRQWFDFTLYTLSQLTLKSVRLFYSLFLFFFLFIR